MLTKNLNLIEFNVAMHDWEMCHASLLKSMTGRHIYMTICRKLLAQQEACQISMKEIKVSDHFSDRALIKRLEVLHDQGFVEMGKTTEDKRTVMVSPNEKILEFIDMHSSVMNKNLTKILATMS